MSVEQDILNDDEDIDDPGSPDIGDDFSRAELLELREHIYQVQSASTPEMALRLSGMQIRKLRLRSKKAYDQDSKNQSCSRPGCMDKKGCYKYRQSKYMEKKFLYSQLPCPQDRDDSDAKNPQVRDPVDTYATTGEWISKDEAQKYYHTHPDVFDSATVKSAMERRFTTGLFIQDLCPIPGDPLEDVTEPEEFRNLD